MDVKLMIIGLNLNSIEAKKHAMPKGNIRIDNNVAILGVKETKVPIMTDQISQISFKFTTNYVQEEKTIGNVTITGNVLYKGDTEAIMEQYKTNKKLPDKVGHMVVNTILAKCIIQTISLSEQVTLPPPIGLPTISNKKKQNLEYIG
ncbi:MAG: hypothetical protein KAS12_00065 [Candidatus Aenigmarchaeota archaeon]|nr:hypothetical protein [Candidatus Aenigmarchaeota archaeon]